MMRYCFRDRSVTINSHHFILFFTVLDSSYQFCWNMSGVWDQICSVIQWHRKIQNAKNKWKICTLKNNKINKKNLKINHEKERHFKNSYQRLQQERKSHNASWLRSGQNDREAGIKKHYLWKKQTGGNKIKEVEAEINKSFENWHGMTFQVSKVAPRIYGEEQN